MWLFLAGVWCGVVLCLLLLIFMHGAHSDSGHS